MIVLYLPLISFFVPAAFSFQKSQLSSGFSFSRDASSTIDDKQALLQIFDGVSVDGNIYACPESLQPLSIYTRLYGLFTEKYFSEGKFGARYAINSEYADLVAPIGSKDQSSTKIGQTFFQNPLVSFAYERGYRQNFAAAGFPGIDKEFEEALAYFVDNGNTGTLMDLSCGSGFMTRRFIKSAKFDRVVSADLSPSMLQETRRNCLTEGISVPEMVRCDSAKLPFRSESFNAVHAGAAMHCWPEVQQSLIEIFRVLKPGGTYFATTFRSTRLLRRQARAQGYYFFDSADEVRILLEKAGFTGEGGSCEVRTEGVACLIIKAIKK